MGDLMLHGVLNMPLPDDPSEMGVVEWFQFRERARQASQRIAADADRIEALEAKLAKAAEGFERIASASKHFAQPEMPELSCRYAHETTARLARTTLAALKGENT